MGSNGILFTSYANQMIKSYDVKDRCFTLGDLIPLFFFGSVDIEKRGFSLSSVVNTSILKLTSTSNYIPNISLNAFTLFLLIGTSLSNPSNLAT